MSVTTDKELKAGDGAQTLGKFDPTFVKLHGTSDRVTIYRYNPTTHLWNKTDKAGSLFLYERNARPQYRLVVMNSKNKNDFVLKFGPDALFVMHPPYLLIRAAEDLRFDAKDESHPIYSVWFHDAKHCVDSATILKSMGLRSESEEADLPYSQILRTGSKETLVDDIVKEATKKGPTGAELPALLSKEQFCDAIMHLIQNDADFVNKIYDGYKAMERIRHDRKLLDINMTVTSKLN